MECGDDGIKVQMKPGLVLIRQKRKRERQRANKNSCKLHRYNGFMYLI